MTNSRRCGWDSFQDVHTTPSPAVSVVDSFQDVHKVPHRLTYAQTLTLFPRFSGNVPAEIEQNIVSRDQGITTRCWMQWRKVMKEHWPPTQVRPLRLRHSPVCCLPRISRRRSSNSSLLLSCSFQSLRLLRLRHSPVCCLPRIRNSSLLLPSIGA